MEKIPLILVGFGPVGQALVRLLGEKGPYCREKYNLAFALRAILRSSKAFLPAGGLLSPISAAFLPNLADQALWIDRPELDPLLEDKPPGVLVEVTPSNLKTGEPGLTHIRKALSRGWHVVTANKAPLLLQFSELLALAREKGVSLKFSGATAAALPALDVGQISLAGTSIQKIEGILNGTTNHILTRMTEGMPYQEALQEAQERGIAEKNVSYDVGGWDTAVKLALLSAALFGICLKLEEMEVAGITNITLEEIAQAQKAGKKIKLLGTIWWDNDTLKAAVKPESLLPEHPLFFVDGTNKGISFTTDSMGIITVIGGKSDPRGAAAALLKDIINIYR